MARAKLLPQQVGKITVAVVGVYPDGSPKYRASARYGDPEHRGSGSPLKRADGPTKAAAENALRAAVAEVFASRGRDVAQANERETADRADAAAAEVTTLRDLVARWHRGLDTANVHAGTITANTVMSVRYTKSDPLNPAPYAPRDDGLDHGRAPDDDEVRDLIEALYRDPRALPHDGGPVVTRPQAGGRVNGADIADATLSLFSVGTRQAEMLALTWSRINLSDHERKVTDATPLVGGGSKREARTLRPGDVWINSSLTRVIGEGGGLRCGPVKVAAANRVLPMSATAVAMLAERAARLKIRVDNPIGTAVFGAPMDQAQFRDNRNFMKKIQALYSDHGYDFGRTHSARKYITTRLHRLGWSDDRIMAYMGWSDRTTLAAYLDRSQEVPDAMGSALAIDFTRPS